MSWDSCQGTLPRWYNRMNWKIAGFLDRYAQLALVAARQAVADAGIEFKAAPLAYRSGVFHGTGIGGQTTQDEGYHRLYAQQRSRLHPNSI